jgi:hypothetical protein
MLAMKIGTKMRQCQIKESRRLFGSGKNEIFADIVVMMIY